MSRCGVAIFAALLTITADGRASQVEGDSSPPRPASQPMTAPATPPPPLRAPLIPEVEPLPMITRSTRSIRTKQAIDRAVKFLLSQQAPDGSWNDQSNSDWAVGQTAIVTLALLSAGQSRQSPPITKAVDFLRNGKISPSYQTYGVALRICVLAQLPEPSKQPQLRADVAWLEKAMIDKEPNAGLFTYGMPSSRETADYSNSQYGVLGAWYAAEAGLQIPFPFWRRAENAWKQGQQRDGGWGYIPGMDDGSYASMTAAGVATLFITNDYLHAHDAYDLSHVPDSPAIDRALSRLGDHFAVDYNPGRDQPPRRGGDLLSAFAEGRRREAGFNLPYMLFGYERVGEASGLTRFGSHRWFDDGADFLARTQFDDGSWSPDGSISGSPEVETAYALLFLSRGLSPVAIQKLQFGTRWNNRARDIADFTFFLRHNTETHFNWQITSLSGSPAEIREAPLLYAASDRAISLDPSETSALKDYLLRGGVLIAANDGESSFFATSIEKLGVELFPDYAFHDLPSNDAAYTGNFPATGVHEPIRILSNGVRKLIVLFPRGDTSWRFQAAGGSPLIRQSPYVPLANLWVEATGAESPLLKGESSWIERSIGTANADKKIRIACVQYDGNWDPEPAGWVRLSNLLHNSGDAELQTDAVSMDLLDSSYAIAHLTGTETIKLSVKQQASLKGYLDQRGLLFFDAAGGSAEAANSIQAILAGIYPESRNEPLPIDHPIYTGTYPGGRRIELVAYRKTSRLPPAQIPRLRGISLDGKLLAIISNEDVSAALVGYPSSDIAGYSPESAAELTRAILLWRAAR